MRNFLLGMAVLGFLVIFGLVFYELGRQSVSGEKPALRPPLISVPEPGLLPEPQPPVSSPSSPMVGNDRDPHGCIGSAGYSWCEAKSKCLRVWEETCPVSRGVKNN